MTSPEDVESEPDSEELVVPLKDDPPLRSSTWRRLAWGFVGVGLVLISALQIAVLGLGVLTYFSLEESGREVPSEEIERLRKMSERINNDPGSGVQNFHAQRYSAAAKCLPYGDYLSQTPLGRIPFAWSIRSFLGFAVGVATFLMGPGRNRARRFVRWSALIIVAAVFIEAHAISKAGVRVATWIEEDLTVKVEEISSAIGLHAPPPKDVFGREFDTVWAAALWFFFFAFPWIIVFAAALGESKAFSSSSETSP